MFILKKLIASLVLPPAGPLLLILLGLCLLKRRPRLGKLLIGLAVAVLFALSLPVVSTRLMRSVEPYPALSAADLDQAQAIVVLGGGSYRDAPEYGGDVAGVSSLERIRYAAWLFRQRPLPILVTGGAPFGGKPEARLMADALAQEFLTPVRWIEDQSRDTAENAEFSARLLKAAKVQRIVLVSHASHLPRAMLLFQREGLLPIPAPTVITQSSDNGIEAWLPDAGALGMSRRALTEWLGYLVYRTQVL